MLIEGMYFSRAQIKSFRKGEKYYKGPYRQWVGYIDPREGFIGESEVWDDLQRGSKAWNGL